MEHNNTFGGDNFNSTIGVDATSGANSERKAEGVVPCFIKQIVDSPEGNFQMWGMTFGMVTCVAIVRNIETSSTKITYTLEDHTGQIVAHYWLEEGDALSSPDVMLNNYTKVFGTTRTHLGKKTLMLFRMTPVEDLNDITTHMLEVMNARYKAEEFSKNSQTTSYQGDFATSANGAGGGFESHLPSTNNLGLEGKQLMVFNAIKNSASEEGISRQALQTTFKQISANELEKIIDFMTSEGHIYSSIDHDHFLATDT